jgi:hypothetical protein
MSCRTLVRSSRFLGEQVRSAALCLINDCGEGWGLQVRRQGWCWKMQLEAADGGNDLESGEKTDAARDSGLTCSRCCQ